MMKLRWWAPRSIGMRARRNFHPLVAGLTKDLGLPEDFCWDYDRAEIVADGMAHASGIALASAGVAILLPLAHRGAAPVTFATALYATGLVTMLGVSAMYNLWPICPRKWILRRFDHAAIYLFIAATSTALLSHVRPGGLRVGILCFIWLTALAGVAVRLFLPGRWERICTWSYFFLGGAGLFSVWWWGGLSEATLEWAALGSGLYAVGTVFHLNQHLRFHNATWHGFVVLAASCHYVAILTYLSTLHQ